MEKEKITTHVFYKNRRWGHDYIFNPIDKNGIRGRMMGWGYGIRNNDYLIIENGRDSTRYQVISVEYKRDPNDMWEAYVKFAPRLEQDKNESV